MGATRERTKPGGERDFADQVRGTGALPTAVLIAATFLSYAATLGFGFVSDDRFQIVGNPFIASWRFLPQYFASHVWSYIYPHLLSNYYRPCFLLWLRLNEAVFGERAWGWHLTSVAVHVAVTYLVFRLGLRLTRDTWVAVAGALVFGLHPVHVEAVAYVSGVAEPLAALFLLAAFMAWLRSREPGPRLRWLAAALALYAAALLSKESSLMLAVLVVVFAWIYAPREGGENLPVRRLRAALVAAAPFLAVTAAYLPLRVWALKGFAHIVTPLALSAELLTIPSVLLFYLRLLVWPFGLSCYYDMPYVSAPAFWSFVLPLIVILLALAALVFWHRWTRRQSREESRAVAFAGFWMALAIAPVLNFRLLPEGEIAHDRYLYLPSVGFVILMALALRQVERRLAGGLTDCDRTLQPCHPEPFACHPERSEGSAVRQRNGTRDSSSPPAPQNDSAGEFSRNLPRRTAWANALGMVLAALLALATARQSLYWSDELSLNFHAHEIAPQNVSATTSLAAAAAARGMVSAAVSLYQQALASHPDFWRANVNLAYLYYQQGNFREAVRYLERSSAADATDGDQFLYLGLARMQLNQLPEAETAIRTALLVRPNGHGYHLGLGLVLKQAGKFIEAKQEFEAALARDPRDAQARALLADVEGQMKSQAGTLGANAPASGQR